MKKIAMSVFFVLNIFGMELIENKKNTELIPLVNKSHADECYAKFLNSLPKDKSKINAKMIAAPLIERINRNEDELVRQYFNREMGWIEALRREHINAGNEKEDELNALANKELFTRAVLSYVDEHIEQQEKLKSWGDDCLALIKPEESNCGPFMTNLGISGVALFLSLMASITNVPFACELECGCAEVTVNTGLAMINCLKNSKVLVCRVMLLK